MVVYSLCHWSDFVLNCWWSSPHSHSRSNCVNNFVLDERNADLFILVITSTSIHETMEVDEVFYFKPFQWSAASNNWNKSMDLLKKREILNSFTIQFDVHLLWKYMSPDCVWLFHVVNKNHICFDALADELECEWTDRHQWILSWNNWYHKLRLLRRTLLLYIFWK
jgi:hypothetical protein